MNRSLRKFLQCLFFSNHPAAGLRFSHAFRFATSVCQQRARIVSQLRMRLRTSKLAAHTKQNSSVLHALARPNLFKRNCSAQSAQMVWTDKVSDFLIGLRRTVAWIAAARWATLTSTAINVGVSGKNPLWPHLPKNPFSQYNDWNETHSQTVHAPGNHSCLIPRDLEKTTEPQLSLILRAAGVYGLTH